MRTTATSRKGERKNDSTHPSTHTQHKYGQAHRRAPWPRPRKHTRKRRETKKKGKQSSVINKLNRRVVRCFLLPPVSRPHHETSTQDPIVAKRRPLGFPSPSVLLLSTHQTTHTQRDLSSTPPPCVGCTQSCPRPRNPCAPGTAPCPRPWAPTGPGSGTRRSC